MVRKFQFRHSVGFIIMLLIFISSCNKDNTQPVITLLGSNPFIYCIIPELPQPFVDPGATAIDDEDGDITSAINTSSNVNTEVPGIYQITYTVEDKAGNTGVAVREVEVLFCK